jgi:cell envelope-related function transcriptional attenuator common domain
LFAVTLLVAFFAWTQFQKSSAPQDGRADGAVGAIQQALNAVPCMPKLKEPLTVLVMGVDWNGKDAERYVGNRSDTMMLVHFDPDSDHINITSIPRDSRVHVARGHGINKINYAHAIGGAKLAVETVEDNFGVHIDNHVVVDTAGLRHIFDLLGPVEVVVEKEMHYEDHTSGLFIDLKPGKQLLNAQQLEGYVRFRKDATADLGRMERQQWFLRQAQAKLRDPAILLKAPELLSTAYDSISTDLPMDKVAEILSFAKDLDGGKIVTATLPGDAATVDGVNYFFVNEDGARTIFNSMRHEPRDQDNAQEPIIAGDMPADYMAAHRKRFGRRHRRLSEDSPIDKEHVRISIKYPRNAEPYAQSTANRLKDQGWQIRHLIGTDDVDCLHAQVDLHTSRASQDIISLLRSDLPTMSKWPLVLKYGAYGSDLTLVLPSRGGMSIWQREARDLMKRSTPTAYGPSTPTVYEPPTAYGLDKQPIEERRFDFTPASTQDRRSNSFENSRSASLQDERVSGRETSRREERRTARETSKREELRAAGKRRQRDEVASTEPAGGPNRSKRSRRASEEVASVAESEDSDSAGTTSRGSDTTGTVGSNSEPNVKSAATVRLVDEIAGSSDSHQEPAPPAPVPLAADPATVPN